jgi:hypothetical protein
VSDTKPKNADSLRTPKPKKKLGLSVPPALRLPHEDLIPSSPRELEDKSNMPSSTGTTSEPAPIAPVKDFTKVANSINREAVPAGLFTGKSKQVYDCLYALSRGAVVPSRTVRVSRPRLMKKAGIGSKVTLDANVMRLVAVGLIEVRRVVGEHNGNEYTVFLPEELNVADGDSRPSTTSSTRSTQKLVVLVVPETSTTSTTSSALNTDTYLQPKTSFKTNIEKTDDDEAFAGLCASLREAAKDVTGREPTSAEAERWRELGEVLTTELKIAAGRTTVSSVPAFLTEHLRRRLWKKEKRQIEAEAAGENSAPAPQVDASKCPDCFGAGMWYPEGYEKGVAKCGHEKLSKAE